MSYLDNAGLTRVWQKIKSLLNSKVDKVDGMGLSQESYTTQEKDSLSSIQNSMNFLVTFGDLQTSNGRIVIGSGQGMGIYNATLVNEETIEDKEQNLIDMIQNAVSATQLYTDNKVNDIPNATTSANGFMSATDKARLDEIWQAWSTKSFLAVAKE